MAANSPAVVLREYLIDQGVFTAEADAGSWPLYVGHMPDAVGVPDNCAAIYDTAGIKDGRLMLAGLGILHPGLQIKVRARTYAAGWAKADAVRVAMDAIKRAEQEVDATDSFYRYRLDNLSQTGTVLPLGTEKGTKRRQLFSINYLATLEETTLVITASTLNTLAHTASEAVTAAQMEGWLHTNSGAGAGSVTLNLPAAADGLHAIFAQVDAGDFILNPQDGDQIYWSGGELTSGGAIRLLNPTSIIWLGSDGAGRWIVLQESGTTVEE